MKEMQRLTISPHLIRETIVINVDKPFDFPGSACYFNIRNLTSLPEFTTNWIETSPHYSCNLTAENVR